MGPAAAGPAPTGGRATASPTRESRRARRLAASRGRQACAGGCSSGLSRLPGGIRVEKCPDNTLQLPLARGGIVADVIAGVGMPERGLGGAARIEDDHELSEDLRLGRLLLRRG